MFVTTFYSYKGGVGRTMAVVNTAFTLSQRGKRVLIIDFDLEAPGIETYPLLDAAVGKPGLVDYVVHYIDTGSAPDVCDYLSECSRDDSTGGSVWAMSAGRRDSNYAKRFASIDWLSLYAERDGYLMFEDLRQQLATTSAVKFDYVLIDSRTGHTDIRGICTRQLPNAVVLMFYPNDQNVSGLALVADEIREQNRARPERAIRLLFCPANVPMLDDEYDIMRRRLESAAKVLQYARPAAAIHHYESLDLLDQKIFVCERPKTRLAEEYRTLTAAIAQHNIEDKEGAIHALRSLRSRYRNQLEEQHPSGELPLAVKSASLLKEVFETTTRIQECHPDDGQIAWELAPIYHQIGQFDSEFEALSIAIAGGHNRATALRFRALNLLSQGETIAAKQDVVEVLKTVDTSAVDISAAIEVLRMLDPSGWIETVAETGAIARLEPIDRFQIADHLTVDIAGSRLAADIIEGLKPDARSVVDTNLRVLSLIGSAQFAAAIDEIGLSRSQILEVTDIQEVFNYAMASWGLNGSPDLALVRRVDDLDKDRHRSSAANYHQCLALIKAVLGDFQGSLERLAMARAVLGPGYVFSCWRYLKVNRTEMRRDLIDMEGAIRRENVTPPFVLRGQKA